VTNAKNLEGLPSPQKTKAASSTQGSACLSELWRDQSFRETQTGVALAQPEVTEMQLSVSEGIQTEVAEIRLEVPEAQPEVQETPMGVPEAQPEVAEAQPAVQEVMTAQASMRRISVRHLGNQI